MAGNRFRKPGWLARPRVRFLHPPPAFARCSSRGLRLGKPWIVALRRLSRRSAKREGGLYCSGCGGGGPHRVVAPDSRKRALGVRILPATPDRAGVIATGRHTRLRPELVSDSICLLLVFLFSKLVAEERFELSAFGL